MKTSTLLLALVALVLGVSTAAAQNGNSTKVDVCGTYYNPCCDEWVDLCLQYNFVVGKNGQMSNLSVHGSGTGSNGNEYVVSGKSNSQIRQNEDGSGSYSVTQSETWVAKGNQDCQFKIHYTVRFDIDSDGNWTPTVENVFITCAGSEIG
jgi:hypothetical protein